MALPDLRKPSLHMATHMWVSAELMKQTI